MKNNIGWFGNGNTLESGINAIMINNIHERYLHRMSDKNTEEENQILYLLIATEVHQEVKNYINNY